MVLLIAAFPFRYSGMRLSVLWLLEAEALLLIGVWTKEIVFRRLGMIATLVVAGQMIAVDAARIFGRRMDGADLRPAFGRGDSFRRRRRGVLCQRALGAASLGAICSRTRVDRRVMQRLSYAGARYDLDCRMDRVPRSLDCRRMVRARAGIGAGRTSSCCRQSRPGLPEFRYQANFLALVVVLRVLAINLEATDKYHGLTLRLMTITLCLRHCCMSHRAGVGF